MTRLSKLPWPLIVPFLALCGMVALLRFTHAEKGTVNPALVGGEQPPALPEGQQHLLQAVESSDWRTAAELLREGADPNLRRPIMWPHGSKPDDPRMRYQGDTLLRIAVSSRDESMVRLLLKHGADVNAPSRFGLTPLMVAAELNEFALVELLLKQGANPNTLGATRQESALHLVTMKYLPDVLPIVLNPNSNPPPSLAQKKAVNRINKQRRPKQARRIALATLLLKAGADPTYKDSSGQTPVDYARKQGDKEMVELLTSAKFTRKAVLAKGAGR